MDGLGQRGADPDGQEPAVGASEVCWRGALDSFGLLFLQNLLFFFLFQKHSKQVS